MLRRVENKNISICLTVGCLAILAGMMQQYNPFLINPSGAASKPRLGNHCNHLSIEAEATLVNICLGYNENGGTNEHNPCCLQIQNAFR